MLESEYRESSILPTLSTRFWNRDSFDVCASSSFSVASYKRNLASSGGWLPPSSVILDEPYVIGLVRRDAVAGAVAGTGGCIILILAGENAIVKRNVALVTSVVNIAVQETHRRRRRDGDHIIPTMKEEYIDK